MEVSRQLHAPAVLLHGSTQYPLDRRLGGPESQSGRGGEEKNFQPLPGLELPIMQPVAQRYTTELFWLFKITYNLTYCFIWAWNLVSHYKGGGNFEWGHLGTKNRGKDMWL
jgi:hypothetical protein